MQVQRLRAHGHMAVLACVLSLAIEANFSMWMGGRNGTSLGSRGGNNTPVSLQNQNNHIIYYLCIPRAGEGALLSSVKVQPEKQTILSIYTRGN